MTYKLKGVMVTDIPNITKEELKELKFLKEEHLTKSLNQSRKDRLDYLEFFKNANDLRRTNPMLAVKNYERAIWEKKVGFVEGLIYKTMRMFKG